MDVKYHVTGMIFDDDKQVCGEVIEKFLICQAVLIVAFDCLVAMLLSVTNIVLSIAIP